MKYHINQNYFEHINSSNKAYWLGYIAADGNILLPHDYRLSIDSIDKELLTQLCKCLHSNSPIQNKHSHFYRLNIYNKQIALNLVAHNITPKKSLTLKFPILDKQLIRHFIRGYFDGDGTIYYDKKYQHPKFSIVSGAKDFLLSIENHLQKTLNISQKKLFKNTKHTCYCLYYNKQNDIIKVYNYLYFKSKIKLYRKYNKIKQLVAKWEI